MIERRVLYLSGLGAMLAGGVLIDAFNLPFLPAFTVLISGYIGGHLIRAGVPGDDHE